MGLVRQMEVTGWEMSRDELEKGRPVTNRARRGSDGRLS